MKKKMKLYHLRFFSRGFSLVELLVVIAIISLTAALLLVSYDDDRAAKELEASSREFVGVLREAQNYALTGRQIGSGTIPCGYKVTWGNSDYNLIYYYRGTSDSSCLSPLQSNASSTLYSKVLKRGVFMTNSELTFKPPHGVPFFGANYSPLPNDVPIPLILRQGSIYHVVCINNKGRLSDHQGSTCPS